MSCLYSCLFTLTVYGTGSMWQITKKPVRMFWDTSTCTYLGVYFFIPERIIKHSKMRYYLHNNAVKPSWYKSICLLGTLLGNLTFISQFPEIDLNHCSWNGSLCRKSFGVNAGIDSIGPQEYCQVQETCRPSEASCSIIELMSMCEDKWSNSISSSGNVALMNRTNLHQIKIHLDEA